MSDPGFTFYADNFLGGTLFFTDEQVGKYMRALCAQKMTGHLTLEQLNVFAKNDSSVISKFTTDENGLYYNVRLQKEIDKKDKFSKIQSEKANKRWDEENAGAYTGALPGHSSGICPPEGNAIYETESISRFNIKSSIKLKDSVKKERLERKFIPPLFEEFEKFCIEHNHQKIAKQAYEGYAVADWHDSRGKAIKNWKQKLIQVWFREDNEDSKAKETQDEMYDRLEREGKI